MNNAQVAVLAASMRTGGRTMNSVQDMLEDSKIIEQYLDQQATEKRRHEQHSYVQGVAAMDARRRGETIPQWITEPYRPADDVDKMNL